MDCRSLPAPGRSREQPEPAGESCERGTPLLSQLSHRLTEGTVTPCLSFPTCGRDHATPLRKGAAGKAFVFQTPTEPSSRSSPRPPAGSPVTPKRTQPCPPCSPKPHRDTGDVPAAGQAASAGANAGIHAKSRLRQSRGGGMLRADPPPPAQRSPSGSMAELCRLCAHRGERGSEPAPDLHQRAPSCPWHVPPCREGRPRRGRGLWGGAGSSPPPSPRAPQHRSTAGPRCLRRRSRDGHQRETHLGTGEQHSLRPPL